MYIFDILRQKNITIIFLNFRCTSASSIQFNIVYFLAWHQPPSTLLHFLVTVLDALGVANALIGDSPAATKHGNGCAITEIAATTIASVGMMKFIGNLKSPMTLPVHMIVFIVLIFLVVA